MPISRLVGEVSGRLSPYDVDYDVDPVPSEFRKRISRSAREVIAPLAWCYIVLKLAVFDVDSVAVQAMAPDYLWILDYRHSRRPHCSPHIIALSSMRARSADRNDSMMGGAKAQYDGIRTFSETEFTDDLRIIDVPTLVMHGDDDQIVLIADSALLSAKLLKKGTLKVYEKFPHGMCTTHADVINANLLAFDRCSQEWAISIRHFRVAAGT